MKIREKIINELDKLSPTDYLSIYQYIGSIKSNRQEHEKKQRENWSDEVRTAPDDISDDPSQDINLGRGDKI